MLISKPYRVATAKELPFHLLDPREFERLCLWLVVLENYDDAQHLGAAGSDQGRDILAFRNGKSVAIQCKRVRRFSAKDAEREIDKLKKLPVGKRPDEIEFIISADVSALTRDQAKSRSAPIPCRFRALTELDLAVKKYPEVVQEFFEGGVSFGDLRPRPRPMPRPAQLGDRPESFDVFISYNTFDQDAAETLASRLVEAGIRPFLACSYQNPGLSWQELLQSMLETCQATIVVLGPRGLGQWQHREVALALDRQVKDAGFRVIPLLLPEADPPLGFLKLNNWIDWRVEGPRTGDLQVLLTALRKDGQEAHIEIQGNVSPFRSLDPFREVDAAFFFGRESSSDALAACLDRKRFVALVGDSGSGKSSLVQAGLIPRIRSSTNPVWEIVTVTPGDRPLTRLAEALLPLLEPNLRLVERLQSSRNLAALLRESETLAETVRTLLAAQQGTDRLLLVVDQWEELYTQESKEQDQQDFIDQLLHASSKAPLSVVLTLRSDFFGKVLGYRPLADRLQDAVVLLGPMSGAELTQAIQGPVKAACLEFDPGLAGRIRDEVLGEPGSLPLLEFVLAQLWEQRRGVLLSAEVYEAIGGVRGALGQRAEAVYALLSQGEQVQLQRIFGRLVKPEGQTQVRRHARLSEFIAEEIPLVWKLIDNRLLTSGRGAEGEGMVEVPHEALLVNWPRLAQWIDSDREFLLWRQRVIARHERWLEVRCDEGTLLRGAELAEAEQWFSKRQGEIRAEKGVITASLEARNRDRNRSNLRRSFFGGVIFLGILGAFLWVWREKARDARELRRARVSAIISAVERSTDDPTLMALFLNELDQPLEQEFAFEVARLANDALQRPIAELVTPGNKPLTTASFSHDGGRIVTACEDGIVYLWDVDGTDRPLAFEGHEGPVVAASFSPDGHRVVSGGSDRKVNVWDIETTGPPLVLAGHQGVVLRATFSPDGSRILTAGTDSTVKVWNANGKGAPIEFGGHSPLLFSAFFSSDGRRIVTADGKARVWSTDGSATPILLGGNSVLAASFSPDGNQVATAEEDRACVYASDGTGEPIVFDGMASRVAYSPNGSRIVTSGLDGKIRVWRADGKSKAIVFEGCPDLPQSAIFSSDARQIVAAGSAGTACIWSVDRTGSREPITLSGHVGHLTTASFSSDGNRILTAGRDGSARVWKARSVLSPKVLGRNAFGVLATSVRHHQAGRITTISLNGELRTWNADGSIYSELKGDSASGLLDFAIFSADGSRIATLDSGVGVQVLALDHIEKGWTFLSSSSWAKKVAISPDGRQVVAAGRAGVVNLWQVDAAAEPIVLTGHVGEVSAATFSHDGRKIVTAGEDGSIRLWNADRSGEAVELGSHLGWMTIAVFSNDGDQIATAELGGRVRLWSTERPGDSVVLRDSSGFNVSTLVFSPDGSRILARGTDGSVRVWSVNDLSLPLVLEEQIGEQGFATFSFDGSQIVTSALDGNVRVWRADGIGQPIVLKGHRKGVLTASFSPDGRQLVTGGIDGAVRLWDLSAEDLLARLAGSVRGCIQPTLRMSRLGEPPEIATSRYEFCLERKNLRTRLPNS